MRVTLNVLSLHGETNTMVKSMLYFMVQSQFYGTDNQFSPQLLFSVKSFTFLSAVRLPSFLFILIRI